MDRIGKWLRGLGLVVISLLGCDEAKVDGGKALSLADHNIQGRALVINYWATWCGPCITEIPEFNALHQAEEFDALVFGVNFDAPTDPQQQQADIAKMGIAFPVLASDPAMIYGYPAPEVLPTTVIISPTGAVLAQLVGPQTQESVLAGLGY